MTHWLPVFVIFLVAGLFLLWLARQGRLRSGLPQGRIIYTDVGAWQKVEQPLFSSEHLLTGRPDYLIASADGIIPVEVKSGRTPAQPYASHVLQLAAYCMLVEASYGHRPRYGVVKYGDRAFAVDYTGGLERELLATLERMRADLAACASRRSHTDVRRCDACGQRQHCDQTLAAAVRATDGAG